MNTIGIHCLGPNTSACLLMDGRLVAMVEEERFTRIKTASNVMPVNAIDFCLREGGIGLGDVDQFALGWDLKAYEHDYLEHLRRSCPPFGPRDELTTQQTILNCDIARVEDELRFALRAKGFEEAIPPIRFVPHHLSHAASTFFNSRFDESLILTIDGSGEATATALWLGRGKEIQPLRNWDIPHSLGWFYAAMTEYLGFRAYTGEGKVMGLAPYGKPNAEIRSKLQQILRVTEGDYELVPDYIYFGPHEYRGRFTDRLTDLLGKPHNLRNEYSPYHLSVAYETQKLLEEAVASIVRSAIAQTGVRNLCVAGGVAMNCKMNGMLAHLPEVEGFYVFPGANDGGTSLGAAQWLWLREADGADRRPAFEHAYQGTHYSNEEIASILERLKTEGASYHEDVEAETARLLSEGAFVGWFQGRMEYGARALGNRSILADPRDPTVKDRINKFVKYREGFRPFCPSLLEEHAERFLVNSTKAEAPYMMIAFEAQPEFARVAPSVVHVDNTVRPQYVRSDSNPRFHRLISEFEKLTGLPVLLNTSFNIRGEPIVNDPVDALKCFFGTGLDALVLGNYIVRKSRTTNANREAS